MIAPQTSKIDSWQIVSFVENIVQDELQLEMGQTWIFPCSCVHIEVLQVIRRTVTISWSHDREDLLYVQHVICWNVETVWSIFVIALGSQVSWISWILWCDKFPYTYRIFWEIQVFLVFFCRDRFSCTRVQKCIYLPSLRTRRCVVIAISCVRFPCSLPIKMTGCPEYPSDFSTQLDFAQSKNLSSMTRFIVGFGFATILFSSFSSFMLFAIVSGQLVKLKFCWSGWCYTNREDYSTHRV